jgi:septum formation protein
MKSEKRYYVFHFSFFTFHSKMQLSRPLIIASNSPRRRQIMADAGFSFDVVVKETDETFPDTIPLFEVPMYLASKKADAFGNDYNDSIILTADTVVIINNEILNKPANEAEATEMLKKLSGQKHHVVTGVCIKAGYLTNVFADVAEVYFRTLTDQEIQHYIGTCKPFDKAGSYGVQDFIGMVGIEKIVGSYFTVMGLPIHKVYDSLRRYIRF